MISVQEALLKIQSNVSHLREEKLSIDDAFNQVLSQDVISPIHMPPFNQSAMDGYAINGCDLMEFDLVGEIQAGDSAEEIDLKQGEAVRIFTGAVVPKGATAVVKQEIVSRVKERIQLQQFSKKGENIRPQGEQIRTGEVALPRHRQLNSGAVGFLYTLGINEATVYRKPKIIVIATGNELVEPGQPLPKGKIYESNTYTLKAALKGMGIEAEIRYVEDDFDKTKTVIKNALDECDLLITTGGISVGDYDFVGQVLEELNVETVFYKVKQKPGKPLYFGRRDDVTVFALPGNPAAVLSCFYMYVTPAILKMMGHQNVSLEERQLKLTDSYKKTASLTYFLKAQAYGNDVTILTAQSSAMLSSFASANCIAALEEGKEEWSAGDEVSVYMLP